MPKYRVHIYQTVYQSATLEVWALDERDAAEEARRTYTNGPELQWRLDDVDDPDIDAELIT